MDFTRNRNVITFLDTKEVTQHKSVNLAKKASRKLQTAGNTMRVVK